MSVSVAAKKGRIAYEADPRLYRLLKWLITHFMRVFYRYRVTGMENIPPTGPVILAVNHLHLLDPFAVAPAIPRQVTTLAAAKWQNNAIVGWFLRSAGTIFVRRGEVDRRALKACLDVLAKGAALALAPEGTRSHGRGLQRAKGGIAYLALRVDVPIVPMSVWGVECLRDWGHLRRPECHVAIGKPFRLPRVADKSSAEDLQRYADLVMLKIGQALPERYRGVYADRVAALEAGQSDEMDALCPGGARR